MYSPKINVGKLPSRRAIQNCYPNGLILSVWVVLRTEIGQMSGLPGQCFRPYDPLGLFWPFLEVPEWPSEGCAIHRWRAREDGGWHVRCPPWHICDPNLMNRWIDLRESVRLNRATETYIVSLWVHDFGLAKTRWVASRCPYSKRSFAPAHERLANDATTRTTNPHNRHTSMQE
jgi:hypothetical protein